MTDARHLRQVILREIGEAGQARLARATAIVEGEGVRAEVAAKYLVGAGLGVVVVGSDAIARAARETDPAARVEVVRDARTPTGDAPFDARDDAARDVAQGAWSALATMRAILAKDAS